MVIGKIFKDRVWRQIIVPSDIEFESFTFANMDWLWNEEKKILINKNYDNMIRINKDDFFNVLSDMKYLQRYINYLESITVNHAIIEDFNTWFNQESFNYLNGT